MAHSRIDMRPRHGAAGMMPVLEAGHIIRSVFPLNTTSRINAKPPDASVVDSLASIASHPDDRVFAELSRPVAPWFVPDPYLSHLATSGVLPSDRLVHGVAPRRSATRYSGEAITRSSVLWDAMVESAMKSLRPRASGGPPFLMTHRFAALLSHMERSVEAHLLNKASPVPFPLPSESPDFLRGFLPPAVASVVADLEAGVSSLGLKETAALMGSENPRLIALAAKGSPAVSDPALLAGILGRSSDFLTPAVLGALISNPSMSQASASLVWDWTMLLCQLKRPRERERGVEMALIMDASGFPASEDVRRRLLFAAVARQGGSDLADVLVAIPGFINDARFAPHLLIEDSTARAIAALKSASGQVWLKVARASIGSHVNAGGVSRPKSDGVMMEKIAAATPDQLVGVRRDQLFFLLRSGRLEYRKLGLALAAKIGSRSRAV